MTEKRDYQATGWCRRMIREYAGEGSLCVDATMGNGNDTEYLCTLAGERGHVLAFDIQEAALEHTKERLARRPELKNYELILDSHVHMDRYVAKGSADCIVFNLGYLPGGDHSVATSAQTTIPALQKSLPLLKKDGLLSICIYSGGDSGFEEKNSVLAWLGALNPKEYLVLVTEYYNRPNHPPIPAMVIRL